jgi:NADPH:quinone reductase-like Zn-dependent oxidoreductase
MHFRRINLHEPAPAQSSRADYPALTLYPGIKEMRALVFKRYGRADQIAFADIPRPASKPDEILVQVHAVSLNPNDYMIPKGKLKPILRFHPPATLGSDLAGVVVEVGSAVTRFKPGDAVFASIFDLGQTDENRHILSEHAIPFRIAPAV